MSKLTVAMPFMRSAIMLRAVQHFDKASGFIVAGVWGGALLFAALAYLTIGQALSARANLETVASGTPQLPSIVREAAPEPVLAKLAERLTKRYGQQIQISHSGAQLKLASTSAESFSTWLAALSYVDIVAPQLAWQIKEFCVGTACQSALMTVTLEAQQISFKEAEPPLPDVVDEVLPE